MTERKMTEIFGTQDSIQAEMTLETSGNNQIPVYKKGVGSSGVMNIHGGNSLYGEDIYAAEEDAQEVMKALKGVGLTEERWTWQLILSIYCQKHRPVIESLWDKITICIVAGRAKWRKRVKVSDCANKQEVEVTRGGLIDFMKEDHQIDIKFAEKRTDNMGYLTWDVENWICVNGQNKFMCCYSLEGRVLKGSTSHNIYDMENDFSPKQAMEIQIN